MGKKDKKIKFVIVRKRLDTKMSYVCINCGKHITMKGVKTSFQLKGSANVKSMDDIIDNEKLTSALETLILLKCPKCESEMIPVSSDILPFFKEARKAGMNFNSIKTKENPNGESVIKVSFSSNEKSKKE